MDERDPERRGKKGQTLVSINDAFFSSPMSYVCVYVGTC